MSGSWSRCRCSCREALGWEFWQVGGFLAAWIIGYGVVQSVAPWFTGTALREGLPDGRTAFAWAACWPWCRR